MARIPSPRGYEKEVGDFIYEWMKKEGFHCFKQEVTENRNNVVGILKGKEGSPRLIFNAHMDTSFGVEDDYWILGNDWIKYSREEVKEEGEFLIGNSIVNDKGPMAAFMMAVKAIKDSGIELKGDIVIGKIGQTPIDEFQGSKYEGKGFGARYLVTHGIVGDFAIVAECTDFAISRAKAGDCWFKITVYGKGGIYTPFLERPYTFYENPNAIYKAAFVVKAIEEWAESYERKNSMEFEDGIIVPKINIGAIRGGLPYRVSQSPGICSIYVDVRLNPNQDPNNVRKELEEVIKKVGVDFSIEIYLYRRGYIAKNVEKLVDSIRFSHNRILGNLPGKVASPYCSMWRDVNVFNEYGIPAITYGPPRYKYGTDIKRANALKKGDLLNASRIYALTALDVCQGINKK